MDEFPQPSDYYGKPTGDSSKTLSQKLRDLYEPSDFVEVQNVDTDPITYQFATPDSVETYSDYPGHKETVQKRVPDVVTLQPGQIKLCPAYEADLMIENLIKQMSLKGLQEKAEKEGVRFKTILWTDPAVQDKLIKQIFIGKQDVVRTYNPKVKDVAEVSGSKK